VAKNSEVFVLNTVSETRSIDLHPFARRQASIPRR